MSTPNQTTKAPERPKHRPTGPQFGGPGAARPAEKAINFGPSLRRLIGRLRPDRGRGRGLRSRYRDRLSGGFDRQHARRSG